MSWSTSELRVRLAPFNRFKPSSKSIFTDRSKAVLLLWIVFVGYASCWYVLFFVALWSPAGKGLTSWLHCVFCFVTFPNVLRSTSESRVRLAPWNWFKPSSKIFYWPFQGGTSFVDLLCFCSVLCLLCFVRVCLCVLRGRLLGGGWPLGSRLWCLLWVCHFPIGILGQVWYLIVSIPDLCNLTYFENLQCGTSRVCTLLWWL